MCVGIYLATDRKLEGIPWNQERAGLNICELSADEEPVRTQVSHQFVYYVGSHTQCGCGFTEDDADAEGSRAALTSYIHTLSQNAPVELFLCWDGGYSDAPQHGLELSAQELAGKLVWLGERLFEDENALVGIRKAAA